MNELGKVNDVLKTAFEKSLSGDFSCLNDIDFLKGHQETCWIYSVAHWAFCANIREMLKQPESRVYQWFLANYKRVLGGDYEIVKRKNDPHHIPDFWLKHNDHYIPVECKATDFTAKGLRQLQRYMDVYGADAGVAVAERLKCDLPNNIMFVRVDKREI